MKMIDNLCGKRGKSDYKKDMDIRIVGDNKSKQNFLDEMFNDNFDKTTLSFEPVYIDVEDISIFIAAFLKDKCVGIIHGHEDKYSGNIDLIILSRAFKETKFGNVLLDEIENYFKVLGKKSISVYIPEMCAWDHNEEHYEYHFLKNNGYVEIEIKEKINENYFDWLRMIKLLN